jgi:hypothetical protein
MFRGFGSVKSGKSLPSFRRKALSPSSGSARKSIKWHTPEKIFFCYWPFWSLQACNSTEIKTFFSCCGVRLSPLGTSATNWPNVPAPDDRWWVWSRRWNEHWQWKPKYSEKTCPSAILSTTKPTWPELGSNPDRRCGEPATNRLSYGTAKWRPYGNSIFFCLASGLLRHTQVRPGTYKSRYHYRWGIVASIW